MLPYWHTVSFCVLFWRHLVYLLALPFAKNTQRLLRINKWRWSTDWPILTGSSDHYWQGALTETDRALTVTDRELWPLLTGSSDRYWQGALTDTDRELWPILTGSSDRYWQGALAVTDGEFWPILTGSSDRYWRGSLTDTDRKLWPILTGSSDELAENPFRPPLSLL